MNKEEISKCINELNSIERMLSTLKPYSDDWFVWNDIRHETEARLTVLLRESRRLNPSNQRVR